MSVPPRLVALIPAAGRSRRMGTPKLLLKLGSETLIRRLVGALFRSGVTDVFVLVRSDDEPLQQELQSLPCHAVVPLQDPPAMRDSVELLIKHIAESGRFPPPDGWFLIPADHPFLETAVLERLRQIWQRNREQIVLPVHNGQRGHPALLPWSVAKDVSEIPADHGLNWLIRRDPDRVKEVPVAEESVLFDLDTPDDFQRAQSLAGLQSGGRP